MRVPLCAKIDALVICGFLIHGKAQEFSNQQFDRQTGSKQFAKEQHKQTHEFADKKHNRAQNAKARSFTTTRRSSPLSSACGG